MKTKSEKHVKIRRDETRWKVERAKKKDKKKRKGGKTGINVRHPVSAGVNVYTKATGDIRT